ncbi:unnamed protein product [Ilex paraguariensis]|uniref:Uncharacterized protein n=1 Tax=Ilex paraguariensis TaxID=185542 RepID=A0ABC8RPN6_9AQUA
MKTEKKRWRNDVGLVKLRHLHDDDEEEEEGGLLMICIHCSTFDFTDCFCRLLYEFFEWFHHVSIRFGYKLFESSDMTPILAELSDMAKSTRDLSLRATNLSWVVDAFTQFRDIKKSKKEKIGISSRMAQDVEEDLKIEGDSTCDDFDFGFNVENGDLKSVMIEVGEGFFDLNEVDDSSQGHGDSNESSTDKGMVIVMKVQLMSPTVAFPMRGKMNQALLIFLVIERGYFKLGDHDDVKNL